jgi:hypothetical protein
MAESAERSADSGGQKPIVAPIDAAASGALLFPRDAVTLREQRCPSRRDREESTDLDAIARGHLLTKG